MELLLALPERRAVAEPVVHARAAHESERRQAEDGAGTHLLFFVTSFLCGCRVSNTVRSGAVEMCKALGRPQSVQSVKRASSAGARTAKRMFGC